MLILPHAGRYFGPLGFGFKSGILQTLERPNAGAMFMLGGLGVHQI